MLRHTTKLALRAVSASPISIVHRKAFQAHIAIMVLDHSVVAAAMGAIDWNMVEVVVFCDGVAGVESRRNLVLRQSLVAGRTFGGRPVIRSEPDSSTAVLIGAIYGNLGTSEEAAHHAVRFGDGIDMILNLH